MTLLLKVINNIYLLYKHESKVLQDFGNAKHNLTAFDIFAKVMKVSNHTEYLKQSIHDLDSRAATSQVWL